MMMIIIIIIHHDHHHHSSWSSSSWIGDVVGSARLRSNCHFPAQMANPILITNLFFQQEWEWPVSLSLVKSTYNMCHRGIGCLGGGGAHVLWIFPKSLFDLCWQPFVNILRSTKRAFLANLPEPLFFPTRKIPCELVGWNETILLTPSLSLIWLLSKIWSNFVLLWTCYRECWKTHNVSVASIRWDSQWIRDRDGLRESLYLAVLNKFPTTKGPGKSPCQAVFLCPLSLLALPPTHSMIPIFDEDFVITLSLQILSFSANFAMIANFQNHSLSSATKCCNQNFWFGRWLNFLDFSKCTIQWLHRCVGHTAWAPKVVKQAQRAAT